MALRIHSPVPSFLQLLVLGAGGGGTSDSIGDRVDHRGVPVLGHALPGPVRRRDHACLAGDPGDRDGAEGGADRRVPGPHPGGGGSPIGTRASCERGRRGGTGQVGGCREGCRHPCSPASADAGGAGGRPPGARHRDRGELLVPSREHDAAQDRGDGRSSRTHPSGPGGNGDTGGGRGRHPATVRRDGGST